MEQQHRPRISVVLPVFNGMPFLVEQIKSILNQSLKVDEILVFIDQSIDGSEEFLFDHKITVIKNYLYFPPNKKFSIQHKITCNFFELIKRAKGDLIFLADQDDIWVKNKVEKVLNSIKSGVLVHDAFVFSDNFINVYSYFESKNFLPINLVSSLIKCPFLGCCMVVEKKWIENKIPKRIKRYLFHDEYIGLLGILNNNLCVLEEPLIYYRRHDRNVSTASSESKRSFYEIFFHRFFLIRLTLKIKFKYLMNL